MVNIGWEGEQIPDNRNLLLSVVLSAVVYFKNLLHFSHSELYSNVFLSARNCPSYIISFPIYQLLIFFKSGRLFEHPLLKQIFTWEVFINISPLQYSGWNSIGKLQFTAEGGEFLEILIILGKLMDHRSVVFESLPTHGNHFKRSAKQVSLNFKFPQCH